MGGTPFGYLVVALVIIAIWWASRPRPLFRLQIRAGRVEVMVGVVTPACIDLVESICRMNEVTSAEIRGYSAREGKVRLEFSHDFPPGARQQFRNWWTENGWNGPPTSPPPPPQQQRASS